VDTSIEIRYAGLVLGRSTTVRDAHDLGMFVGFAEPLPVGTQLTLKVGDALRDARVDEVVESADPGAAGMRVTFAAAPAPAPADSTDAAATAAGDDGVPQSADEGGDSSSRESNGSGGRRRRKRK
jgi:hypothetical protein